MRSTPTKLFLPFFLILAFSGASSAFAQDNAAVEADVRRAIQLVQSNRLAEALPILEKLYSSNPENPLLLEMLAHALATSAVNDTADLEKRRNTLVRARQLAEKAQKLGYKSPLVQLLLTQIPPDGNIPVPEGYAKNPQAEEAMKAGEVAFSRGELQKAIELYDQAFKLEPDLYEAPLFTGDAHWRMGSVELAGQSYARAIALDPDRDTAYRYWGDVLLRNNQLQEAKEKFVEGVIAEPYAPETWQFLGKWAQRAGVQLAHPRIERPRPSASGANTVEISPGKVEDGSAAWIGYSLNRAAWAAGDTLFKKAYPQETKPRHSMKEEAMGLETVVATIEEGLKKGDLKESDLQISIANLLKVHRAGLLEAFILLAMADEGISQDYEEYRKQNRDKLRRYLNEFVTNNR